VSYINIQYRQKMEYKLFLDDHRTPGMVHSLAHTWIHVKSYQEFVDTIKEKGLPTHISFDHDLADEHYDSKIWRDGNPVPYETYIEKTGYDCAK